MVSSTSPVACPIRAGIRRSTCCKDREEYLLIWATVSLFRTAFHSFVAVAIYGAVHQKVPEQLRFTGVFNTRTIVLLFLEHCAHIVSR